MQRQDMIARRAFELFQDHMTSFNAELDDWLKAERELAMPPQIQFRREDGHFEIDAAMPGVDPKKLDVKVTSEDVLITAERETLKPEGKTAAEAGQTSDGTMRYFSAIHLPEPNRSGRNGSLVQEGRPSPHREAREDRAEEHRGSCLTGGLSTSRPPNLRGSSADRDALLVGRQPGGERLQFRVQGA